MKDTYRLAASLLLLRPTADDRFELLLLHKPRKRDAWQLPQGGVEQGETTEECALRELQEEAGITDIEILGKSALVYQYDFPTSYRRFRPDHICGQRIEFVFAVTDADTQVVVDKKEIDKFLWIHPAEIGKYIKRKEYLELVLQLLKEALDTVKG